MDIRYRVISIDEKDHSFIVRYYTDVITEDSLSSFFNDDGSIKRGLDGTPLRCRSDYNLTMFNVHATPEDIDKQIKISAPVDWFKMLEHVKQNETTTALTSVKDKINVENVFTHQPLQPKPLITDAEVEALIAKINAA